MIAAFVIFIDDPVLRKAILFSVAVWIGFVLIAQQLLEWFYG